MGRGGIVPIAVLGPVPYRPAGLRIYVEDMGTRRCTCWPSLLAAPPAEQPLLAAVGTPVIG